MQKVIQCRWSPTLGALEDTHEKIWGTVPYTNDQDPAIFFGIYGLPDFYALWRHKGPKWILWAGTDILHFKLGYWLNNEGNIHIGHIPLAQWINTYCDSWCENEVEQKALLEAGIESEICPSFLGDVHAFPISYQASDRPKLYASVSGNNFEQYGWHLIPGLAEKNPGVEFHLYGNSKEPPYEGEMPRNMFLHGRVPKEQMNAEIATMQGGLRLTRFDGFSEIVCKSVLMGQWPVSLIPYPHMLGIDEIGTLKDKKEANIAGREYYLKTINRFPWNTKI